MENTAVSEAKRCFLKPEVDFQILLIHLHVIPFCFLFLKSVRIFVIFTSA